jgi:hypothetical protein
LCGPDLDIKAKELPLYFGAFIVLIMIGLSVLIAMQRFDAYTASKWKTLREVEGQAASRGWRLTRGLKGDAGITRRVYISSSLIDGLTWRWMALEWWFDASGKVIKFERRSVSE